MRKSHSLHPAEVSSAAATHFSGNDPSSKTITNVVGERKTTARSTIHAALFIAKVRKQKRFSVHQDDNGKPYYAPVSGGDAVWELPPGAKVINNDPSIKNDTSSSSTAAAADAAAAAASALCCAALLLVPLVPRVHLDAGVRLRLLLELTW